MVSTVTHANVLQDTQEIIVKLVRLLKFSFQRDFVSAEVISKNLVHGST